MVSLTGFEPVRTRASGFKPGVSANSTTRTLREKDGARGGNRTRNSLSANYHLKIACLPISPPGQRKYGVHDRTRTDDNQDHNLGLYQLNYAHRKTMNLEIRAKPVPDTMRMVRGMRIELITYGLEGHCSIQLSYPRRNMN